MCNAARNDEADENFLYVEASELEIEEENAPYRNPPFMDFADSEIPPMAPEIERSGIVVTDITEQFLNAAKSMFICYFLYISSLEK